MFTPFSEIKPTAVMKMETPMVSPINHININMYHVLVDDTTIFKNCDNKPTRYGWLKKLEMKIALFIFLFKQRSLPGKYRSKLKIGDS